MLFFDGGVGLLLLGLWLFCLIDVITTPESDCRNLPKVMWLLIVLLLPDIGSIVWLVAGRNWDRRNSELPYKGNRDRRPDVPRAGSSRGGTRNPDDDEDFQARLKARVEEQRRRAQDGQQGEERPPTA